MDRIKIKFVDFWPGFDYKKNFFTDILSLKYEVVISKKPDLVIYSNSGRTFEKYSCIKIYYTGENRRANFAECDYAFTFEHSNTNRHYRLPLYALAVPCQELITRQVNKEKSKFCNFVFKKSCEYRTDFFKTLCKYKKVDSVGKCLHNTSYFIGPKDADKINFIKDYKFTIAMENCSHSGYTTEKIAHALLAGSIPIYWGNRDIGLDFNPKCFINCHDYNSIEEVIEKVIEIDNNDELYLSYLNEPCFVDNQLNTYVNPENILKQFEVILKNGNIL